MSKAGSRPGSPPVQLAHLNRLAEEDAAAAWLAKNDDGQRPLVRIKKAKRPLTEAERIAKARRRRKMIVRKQRAANQAHKARQASAN